MHSAVRIYVSYILKYPIRDVILVIKNCISRMPMHAAFVIRFSVRLGVSHPYTAVYRTLIDLYVVTYIYELRNRE